MATRWREVERIGPFTATFARGRGHPALNYAVPDESAEPAAEEVDALVAAFRARDLLPRLEYVPTLAPAVEPTLLAAGFGIELRAPLLVLGRRRAAPAPAGIELLAAASDDDLGSRGRPARSLRRAGAARRELASRPSPSLDAGGILVLARDLATGEATGGGQCTAPEDGATELTSTT